MVEQITATTPLNLYDFANIFNVYVTDGGLQFYNLFNNITIDGDIDPSLYTAIYFSSIDDWYSLSQKYYGTTRLWWIILISNKIQNPFDNYVGKKIKILKTTVVSSIVSQLNN